MRIAVVGTGIAGLASAWLLSSRHDVHVFERRDRLGGHTHTVEVDRPGGPLGIDTGFIVHNDATYPLLVRLFEQLGVATQPSDMSWSLRCERCALEYAGNARGVFAQPGNLADPTHLRMLADIQRFNRLGRRLIDDPRAARVPLGRFLDDAGFGHGFTRHYLLPMASAIWSSGTGAAGDLPLGTLLRFFSNHGLLGVGTHHQWRTVVGGSSAYLPALTAPFAEAIHLGNGVRTIARDADGVTLRLDDESSHRFDVVVLASHADQSLGLLADPTRQEKELLGAWGYADNDTYLHTDRQLMPRSRRAWASWNYRLADCREGDGKVSLNYHMNRLQGLDEPQDYLVSLNPTSAPRPDRVLARMNYRHPVFDTSSVATQERLGELDGRHRTYYAGAYQRYGFHEDGLFSAVRVADRLGVRWPS